MRSLLTVAAIVLCGVLVAQHAAAKRSGNHVAMMVQSHFLHHGVRLPTPQFTTAMREAAIDISHLTCRKSLVILAMANEEALKRTVPLFLQSLRRVKISGGKHAGETFDGHLVLVAWSRHALKMCLALRSNYSHQCVRDAEHGGGKKPFGFHSDGFNALGFAKVKYILNGLSAGHDIMFLDADIVLMRDPVPYFYDHSTPGGTGGGDVYSMSEKCLLFDRTESFAEYDYVRHQKPIPPLNIGVLYFKATAVVTRCVYGWIWDMYGQVAFRPHIWDQDIFGVLMPKCAYRLGIRLQALDPRLFQSACYPRCGCAFDDANVTAATHCDALGGVPPLPPAPVSPGEGGRPNAHLCDPALWDSWLLRHFACSGQTVVKEQYMAAFTEGLLLGRPADITKAWPPNPPRPPRPRRPPASPGAGG